jgi:hypothetical protein
VGWLEWPAVVSAASPGKLLVNYIGDFCSTQSFVLTRAYPVLTLNSTVTPTGQLCPETLVALPIDTLFPFPSLAVAGSGLPVSYAIQATLRTPTGDPVIRSVGYITLDQAPDTTRYMAGMGTLDADSVGCPIVRGGFSFLNTHTYAVDNMPSLNGTPRVAMVGAHVVTGAAPAGCGSRRLVHLDYAEVLLVP